VEENNMLCMSHEKWRISYSTRLVWFLHDTCPEIHHIGENEVKKEETRTMG